MTNASRLLLGALACACGLASAQAMDGALPFSDARWAGDFLFLSGQVGEEVETRTLVAGGIAAQTRQALQNIDRLLVANGLQSSAIAKCTVFLVNLGDLSAFNQEYGRYFAPPRPSRSLVAVCELSMGSLVEIECLAHVRQHTKRSGSP